MYWISSGTLHMNLKVETSLRSHIPFLRLIFLVGKDTSHFTDFEQVIIKVKVTHFSEFEQVIIKISRFADFEQVIYFLAKNLA